MRIAQLSHFTGMCSNIKSNKFLRICDNKHNSKPNCGSMKCTRVNMYIGMCTLRNFSWFSYLLCMGYIHFHHSLLPIFAVLLMMASKLYMSCTDLAGWQLDWSRHITSTKCCSWFHLKLFMTGYWGCSCVAVGRVWRGWPRSCAAAEVRSRSVGIPWTEFSH